MKVEKWCTYNEKTGGVTCSICIEKKLKNPYTVAKGCLRPKMKQSIQEHARNGKHTIALDEAEQRPHAGKVMREARDRGEGLLSIATRTTMAINIGYAAFSAFPLLMGLQVTNGVPGLVRDGVYQSAHTCKEFSGIFSEMLDQELMDQLKQSPFFTLQLDESTDVSMEKHLAIYITYKYGNKPVTRFLQLRKIQDADAGAIVNAVVSVCASRGISMSKLVGLGTDGASVMIGHLTGVGVRLRQLWAPHLL